ncbi:MAG: PEGA domain-containing protein [Acidobacteria bacterium]|nr:PEGA domain-containing protein [Acidobacteriota bacterium]
MGPRLLVEDDRGRAQVLKLLTDMGEDAAALASALDELRQTLPIHPSLLPLNDIGVFEDGVYMTSPVLTAPSVEGRLRGGRQSLDATLPWLRAVTSGLQAAHDAGVFHGAIHPRDILVTDDGGVLTGVGLAPALERLHLQAPVRVPFTAPERASGRPWDARADQYSLAMLALDALSGRRLIAGTIPAFDRWTLAETPAEDARLHEVFVKALDPDPDRRFDTVEAWLMALAGDEGDSDQAAEAGALSRFARDGVILATPLGTGEPPREIRVQSIDGQKGDSLSLFPEEATIDGPVVPLVETAAEAREESPAGRPIDTGHWLVADVPDDAAVEPDPEPVPVAEVEAEPPTRQWRLDDDDGHVAGGAAIGPREAWEPDEESAGRRPWLLLVVALVMAALAYGTWRSLSPSRASGPAPEHVETTPRDGRDATAPAAARDGASVTPTPESRAPQPPPTAPTPVPQAPVSPRPSTPTAERAVPPVVAQVPGPAPAEPTGRVLIRSSPSGQVRVNGVARGETPVTLRDLPFGEYAIAISSAGFTTAQESVMLSAAQPAASVDVTLVRGGATPPAARPVAAPPPVAPAPPQAAPAPATVQSPAARPAPSSASQDQGRIFVVSTPAQARLIVDGVSYGSTPASIPGLSPGVHVVRLEIPGYKPWEGRVVVIAGISVPVRATLQQEQE